MVFGKKFLSKLVYPFLHKEIGFSSSVHYQCFKSGRWLVQGYPIVTMYLGMSIRLIFDGERYENIGGNDDKHLFNNKMPSSLLELLWIDDVSKRWLASFYH